MRTNRIMNTGIYAIEHVATGRCYVGSAKDFGARWRTHRCLLRQGAHHSPHLQAAWNKYSEDAFVFKKLLVCSPENLIAYEQRLLDGYQAANRKFGFNARALAESSLGHKASPETRAKIKAARANQVFSAETRALWSKNRTGRKMPEGFGEFTRAHKTGTKHTPEARAKISAAGVGRPQSVTTREKRGKISAATAEAIRSELLKGGVTQTALAARYGVHQSTVSLVNSGTRWNLTSLGETT